MPEKVDCLDRFSAPTGPGSRRRSPPPRPPRPGLGGHRLRPPHADPGPDRLGQDAGRLPLGPRPAAGRRRAGAREAALPGALRLAAQGPDLRRRAQPAVAAGGHRHGGRAGRAGPPVGARRHPHRRHARRRAARHRPPPARHPHHHARVALPDAHLGGPRGAGVGRARDHRRDPRRGRHQAGHPPGPVARAARAARDQGGPAAAAAHRPVGHPAAARRGGPLPRRAQPAADGTWQSRPVEIVDAGVRKELDLAGDRPRRGHGRAGPAGPARRGASLPWS